MFLQITDTNVHKGVKTRNVTTAAIDEERYLHSRDTMHYEELQKNMLKFVQFSFI